MKWWLSGRRACFEPHSGGFCGRAGDWVTWPGARFAPFYSYPIIRRKIELFYMTKT